MADKDLHNNVKQAIAFNGATLSTDTTTNGNIIDTQYFHSVEFILQVNARSAGTVTPLIQDGNDPALTDAAAVDDTFLLGTEAAAALNTANSSSRIGYIGKKRYVRLCAVTTGTANLYFSSVAVKGHPSTAPTDLTSIA
jgi:hypothetical protein